jgi:hypothetical protein
MLKAVGDIASTMSSMLLIIGDRLGLYKTMAESGPITSEELAKKTSIMNAILENGWQIKPPVDT